jgi:hypothetical protein
MNNKNVKLFRSILFIIFLINPIISIIVLIFFYVKIDNLKLSDKRFFFFLLSLFLGAINASKTIDGDLGFYNGIFNWVGAYDTVDYFKNYILTGKEIGYAILNFFGFYISFGSWKFYITLVTFLIYMPLFLAIDKYYESYRSIISLSGVILISFFFQYFSLSTQLVRQCIAVSLMLYALVNFSKGNKKIYFLIISSIFIHKIVLILPFFLMLKSFYYRFSLKNIKIIILNLFSVLIVLLITLSLNLFPSEKINQIVSSTDVFVLKDQVYFIFISVIVVVIVIHNIIPPNGIKFFLISNICLMLILLSLVAKFFSPLVSYRYFFVIYMFLPFLVPLLFHRKTSLNFSFNSFLIAFMFLFFFINFKNAIWNYAPIEEIIFMPFKTYFL